MNAVWQCETVLAPPSFEVHCAVVQLNCCPKQARDARLQQLCIAQVTWLLRARFGDQRYTPQPPPPPLRVPRAAPMPTPSDFSRYQPPCSPPLLCRVDSVMFLGRDVVCIELVEEQGLVRGSESNEEREARLNAKCEVCEV